LTVTVGVVIIRLVIGVVQDILLGVVVGPVCDIDTDVVDVDTDGVIVGVGGGPSESRMYVLYDMEEIDRVVVAVVVVLVDIDGVIVVVLVLVDIDGVVVIDIVVVEIDVEEGVHTFVGTTVGFTMETEQGIVLFVWIFLQFFPSS
jgi:hypothetical protein